MVGMKSQNEQELIMIVERRSTIRKQDIVILTGDWGAGKQPLQKGFAQGLIFAR